MVRWVIRFGVLLMLFHAATAFAEDVTVTTYYPSPRGKYKQLQVTDSVGIGTTAPKTFLHVSGAEAALNLQDSAASANSGAWAVQSTNSGGNALFRVRAVNDAYNDGLNALVISRSGIASVTSYFENGNVGIGTTSPAEHVQLNGPDPQRISLVNTTGSVEAVLSARSDGVTSWGWVGTATNHDVFIGTNGRSKLRVTTAGDLDMMTGGIRLGGVTRTSWPAAILPEVSVAYSAWSAEDTSWATCPAGFLAVACTAEISSADGQSRHIKNQNVRSADGRQCQATGSSDSQDSHRAVAWCLKVQ